MNLHRRQLNASQRAMVALEIEKIEAKLAKERLSKTGGHKAGKAKIPYPEQGQARDKAAAAVGVSPLRSVAS